MCVNVNATIQGGYQFAIPGLHQMMMQAFKGSHCSSEFVPFYEACLFLTSKENQTEWQWNDFDYSVRIVQLNLP